MASWSIEGMLGLKTAQFDAALNNAAKKANHFGKEVAATMGEAKEKVSEVLKETGGSGIGKVLGIAGATAAVATFAGAVTETATDAIGAFENMETKALSLGKVFNRNGMDVQKWVDSIAGARGKADDLSDALMSLGQSGLTYEDSQAKLLQLSEVSTGGGDNIREMGNQIRKAAGGGLDKGESAAKLLKGFKNLQTMIQPEITLQAESFRTAHTRLLSYDEQQSNGGKQWGMSATDAEEYQKMKHMDAHEFVQNKGLTSAELWKLIGKSTAPGGEFYGSVAQAKTTVRGKKADAAQAWEDNLEEMGGAIATGLKPALDALIAEMPKLTPLMTELGAAIGGSIKWLVDNAGPIAEEIRKDVADVRNIAGSIYKAGGGLGEESVKLGYDIQHGWGAYDKVTTNPAQAAHDEAHEKYERMIGIQQRQLDFFQSTFGGT